MAAAAEKLCFWGKLHQHPHVHDRDPVTDMAQHPQVVADHHQGQAMPLFQILQQFMIWA